MTGANPHLLVLGYGYSARRVGARCLAAGWRVSGTSRTPRGVRELEEAGIQGIRFEAGDPGGDGARLREALASASHLLVAHPPPEEGDRIPGEVREGVETGSRNRRLGWVGLLSTTGVYGDRGGGWVDETTEPRPGAPRTRRRLEFEEAWSGLASRLDLPLQLFRVAGIYGPGRSPLDRVRSGRARRIVKEGSVFNRIHVDDLAGAVLAGMAHPEATGVFNLADGEPASSHEVLGYAAELLGVEPPPEVPWEEARLSPMGESFFAEDRRVRSRRVQEELGYRLLHPGYRQGLKAILDQES